MKASPWVIAVAAIALAVVAGQFGRLQYRRAERFEAQSRLALDHEHVAQIKVDLLTDEVSGLRLAIAKQRKTTTRAREIVAVADSVHPPDTSHTVNIAARDAVIASQAIEIDTLNATVGAQAQAIDLLQASKNELASALRARPKFYPRFIGPNIGLGVFAGAVGLRPDGKPALGVGVGITINIFSVRL